MALPKKFTIHHSPSGGFTLIEVLIVVAIIGVVSSLVTVVMVGGQAKARDGTRKAGLRQIAGALQEYYIDHNFSYPVGDYTSQAPGEWISGLSPYFKSIPKDPKQASLFSQFIAFIKQVIGREKLQGEVAGVNDMVATYDATLKAPSCATTASSCDSGTLLNGRDAKGPEPNQPNTINNSCSDGGAGTYHSDESNDKIKVSTLDGNLFTPGATVKIETTVWAYSPPSGDYLDLYYSANANSPTWTFITTLTPTVGGAQTLTANYTLPSGSLQAVRGNFRYSGSVSSCSLGTYDDHDDLIFAVGGAAASPSPSPAPTPTPTPSPVPTPSPSPSPSPLPSPSPTPTPAASPTPTPGPSPTPTPAASPTPTPSAESPAPSSSPAASPGAESNNYFYGYYSDGQSFVLWAHLERKDDEHVWNKPTAVCRENPSSTPPEYGYNYCVKSP